MGAKLNSPKTTLDDLAWSVAEHETHNCKDDTNFTRVNNCFGIKKLRDGKLRPARYATKKDSYEDFKDIWTRLYGGRLIPTKKDANTWSGGDKASAWHKNVLYFLNKRK